MSKKFINIYKTALCVILIVSALGLTGCDQLRNQISALVVTKTPQESLVSAKQDFSEGKLAQALDQAEPLAKKPGELQPAFALLAAQIYARTGKPDEALVMLGKALEGNAVEATSLITHPDFEILRTDVRFLALLTHSAGRTSAVTAEPVATGAAPAVPAQSPGSSSSQVKNSDVVSVEIGPGGVSAKAGSVSVKLPP